MAEDKKAFLLYADLIHTFEELEDDEAGKLIKHMLRYVNDRNPVAPDRLTKIAFEPIKHQLKRDLIKYEAKKKQWSEAGRKSAEARMEKNKSTKKVENTIIDTSDFFYIGIDSINEKPSEYIQREHAQKISVWCMQNKVDASLIYPALDKECLGQQMTSESHLINTFKSIARKGSVVQNVTPYSDEQLRQAKSCFDSGGYTPEWFDKQFLHLLK